MKLIAKIITGLVSKLGITGAFMSLISSIVVTLILLTLPVIIGLVMDKLFIYLCRIIAKPVNINTNTVIKVLSYITFPGVMIHELSHAFMVWLFGGNIVELHLLELTGNGRMGAVIFQPRGTAFMRNLQCAASAIAPVFMGLIACWMFIGAGLGFNGIGRVICFYLAVCVMIHASMSMQDVKSYKRGVLVLGLIIFVASYYVCRYSVGTQ